MKNIHPNGIGVRRARLRVTGAAPLIGVGGIAAIPTGDLNIAAKIALLTAVAVLLRALILWAQHSHFVSRRVLVLGTGSMAAALVAEIESSKKPRYVVVGVVGEPEPTDRRLAEWWLGTTDELSEILARERPARIVLALDDRRGHLPAVPLLESRMRGIVVEDALEFYERLTGKIAIEALTPCSLILSKGFRNHGAAEVTARIVSVLVAGIGLIVLAPFLAAIAVAIKLDSRGPVLFVQERTGKHARPFKLLKFRTMHPAVDRRSEWVQDNLDRITRVGRVLRCCRADELVQLINVLRGEMNLIGPRPHPTSNQGVFIDRIAYYPLRSVIPPGVTGWAQVRYGYANGLEEETEKMRYDLYYIKNRTLWLDLRIILETIGVMVAGGGAARVRHEGHVRNLRWPVWPRRATGRFPVPRLIGPGDAEPSMGRR